MNDEQMRRLREMLDENDARERERRQELRREIHSNADRDAAISAAARTAMIVSIPSVAWLVITGLVLGFDGVVRVILGLYCFIPVMLAAAVAGTFCGLFAHWWFGDSTIPTSRIAVATALIVDGFLFGWVFVLTR